MPISWLITTDLGGTIVSIDTKGDITHRAVDGLTTNEVGNLYLELHPDRDGRPHSPGAALTRTRDVVGSVFGAVSDAAAAKVVSELRHKLGEVLTSPAMVIPTGLLSVLPLQAAFPFVRLAPSGSVLVTGWARYQERGEVHLSDASIVAFTNSSGPWKDLPAASAEGEWLQVTFGAEHHTQGDALARTLLALESADVLHIAVHGLPTPSFLFAGRTLSEQILSPVHLTENSARMLQSLRLFVANCCSSGMVDGRSIDEALGFATVAMAYGTVGCLVALWPLVDSEADRFIRAFYIGLSETGDALMALEVARKQSGNSATANAYQLIGW
jgi:hypothetical protein